MGVHGRKARGCAALAIATGMAIWASSPAAARTARPPGHGVPARRAGTATPGGRGARGGPAAGSWPAAAGQPITGAALGTISISAPGSAALGTVTSGTGAISGPLGRVVVSCDAFLVLLCAWSATVTASDFTSPNANGSTTTIPASDAFYTAGTATTTGTLSLSSSGSGSLGGTVAAQSTVLGLTFSGSDSATWNPTITVTIPMSATAGTYTATITHSAA